MTETARLLVVDDDPAMLRTIELAVQSRGYDIVLAADGENAMRELLDARAAGWPFAMLLTDIVMPQVNGIDLLHSLRDMELSLPVVVMTGFGTRQLENELRREGCRFFLGKPFSMKQLFAVIERALAAQPLRQR